MLRAQKALGVIAKPPVLSDYERQCLEIYQVLYTSNRGKGVRFVDIKAYCDLYRMTNLDEINALVTVVLGVDRYVFNYQEEQKRKEEVKNQRELNKVNKRK